MQVYHSLRDYGLVLIQPKLRMDLDVAQRIVRDYMYLVRSIYIQSDQIAIVCFQTKDSLLQQTVQERFKVGLKSTLSHPEYPEFHLEVGYNTAVSQVQDEVLQDIAYATIHKETLEKFVHIICLSTLVGILILKLDSVSCPVLRNWMNLLTCFSKQVDIDSSIDSLKFVA